MAQYEFDTVVEYTMKQVLAAVESEQVDGWECFSITTRLPEPSTYQTPAYVAFLRRPLP